MEQFWDRDAQSIAWCVENKKWPPRVFSSPPMKASHETDFYIYTYRKIGERPFDITYNGKRYNGTQPVYEQASKMKAND